MVSSVDWTDAQFYLALAGQERRPREKSGAAGTGGGDHWARMKEVSIWRGGGGEKSYVVVRAEKKVREVGAGGGIIDQAELEVLDGLNTSGWGSCDE